MTVFIGGAWPYANGSLHIGHIAALLPGDILARYFRLKGERVCYVSGSDCHGTPIRIRAKNEGVSPESIASYYHGEFAYCFEKLGFSYDLYNRTNDEFHKEFVRDFLIDLRDKGYLHKKTVEQAYCGTCRQFLPDRFVLGRCPHCGGNARGDQCDTCGSLLEPFQLHGRKCGICGEIPEFRPSEHFFLALPELEAAISQYVNAVTGWRTNALHLSRRYIEEGLRDRAVTRDLDWGIDAPFYGCEDKKVYVWVDAVLGYLSASLKWALAQGKDWDEIWSGNSTHYYVHGKDNIPFHSVILPALLMAAGGLHLPDRIISSEYLTLEGRKISTSGNWAVWAPYLLEHYNPDSIRYFFTVNGPEKRDTDFSWREFINSHNGELLGAYGNFVNRSLVFIHKYFEGKIPAGTCDSQIQAALQDLYPQAGKLIAEGSFKEAIENIFRFIRSANKFFDGQQPWVSVKEDPGKCGNTLYTCVQAILNLSVLLEPFLPFSSRKILKMLNATGAAWGYSEIGPGSAIGPVEILFDRIDKKVIEEETQRLR